MSAKTDHFHTQHQSLGENDFTRTRWWWVRHAPVRSSGGRIYGQSDIDCDTGDAFAYDALARILPRGAVWLTSHLQRTTLTADAIWRSPHWDEPSRATQIRAFAEQDLGVWQGMDRASFMKGRVAEPGSYWFGPAEEKPEGGESFVDLVDRVRPRHRRADARACGSRYRRRRPWRLDPRRHRRGAQPEPAGRAGLRHRELRADAARSLQGRERRGLARRDDQPPALERRPRLDPPSAAIRPRDARTRAR
jgi:hypothetical protein